MTDSAYYRELRSGKRYKKSIESEVNENDSTEENVTGNSSENVEGEVSEI